MDIEARIERRQRREGQPRLIQDYESLSPVAHLDEPSGRGPVLERLLDHLDPAFDGRLPPNAYLYGPAGSGKSAVVTALFAELERLCTDRSTAIHTSTRAATPAAPRFVYVDARSTASEFEFYHAILDALVGEAVPEHGISTDDLRDRLYEVLGGSPGAVVTVDHADDPGTAGADELIDRFANLPSNVSWLAVGRAEPGDVALTTYTATTVAVDPYRRQALVDLLMVRMSAGLARRAVDHGIARRVADWADGNAHDALAVVFVAADRAARADRRTIGEDDVDDAIEEVPEPCVSLGRAFALPENRQVVLRTLVDLDAADRASVTETTEAISSDPEVDLSPGTVKRFLYEMAEVGVVERVQSEEWDGRGRPPSRVELRFPPTAFRRLYDLRR